MFIEKFAQRVDSFVEKHFHHSTFVNCLYLLVLSTAEFALYWFLAHSAHSDMFIAKAAAVLLLADSRSRFFFAAWIIFTNQAKANEKYLRVMHYFLLLIAVMGLVTFFALIFQL